MDDLRSKSLLVRITVYALFGLLILSFGLWGIGDYVTSSAPPDEIADIDGTPVSLADYENRLRLEARQIQQRTQQTVTQEMLMASGIAQRSLRILVERALLDRLAQDLGLAVSAEQVAERIARQQQFQDARGQFDQQRYFALLRNSGLSPQAYEAEVKTDLERQFIVSAIVYGAQLPQSGSNRIYSWREEQRSLSYVSLPPSDPASIEVPDKAALEDFYEERKDSFRAPEYRSVSLLHITADSFMEAVDIGAEELAAAVAQQEQNFGSPERRSWRQIIFPLEAEAKATAAKAEAEAGKSLVEAARDNGATAPAFLELQSKSRVEGRLPQLADAVFADSIAGDIVLAKTPLGWHVIEITEVVPPNVAAPETVEAAVREDLRMEKAVDAMVSFVNEVDAELATGATLDETARKMGLTLRQIEALDSRGNDKNGLPVAGLPALQDFLVQVFDSDTGVDSLLKESSDGSYYAFRVDAITPAADRIFDEVEQEIADVWKMEEAQRQALAQAEALVQLVENGEMTVEAAARSLGQPIITAPPMTRIDTPQQLRSMPALVRRAFQEPSGRPFAVATAKGAAIGEVTEIVGAKASANDHVFEQLQNALDRDMREDLLTGFISSLELDYPVSYNATALDAALLRF